IPFLRYCHLNTFFLSLLSLPARSRRLSFLTFLLSLSLLLSLLLLLPFSLSSLISLQLSLSLYFHLHHHLLLSLPFFSLLPLFLPLLLPTHTAIVIHFSLFLRIFRPPHGSGKEGDFCQSLLFDRRSF